jgi:hypothetical protein
MLTPKNISQKTVLTPKLLRQTPSIRGLHKVIPHNTPKTAPRDST